MNRREAKRHVCGLVATLMGGGEAWLEATDWRPTGADYERMSRAWWELRRELLRRELGQRSFEELEL